MGIEDNMYHFDCRITRIRNYSSKLNSRSVLNNIKKRLKQIIYNGDTLEATLLLYNTRKNLIEIDGEYYQIQQRIKIGMRNKIEKNLGTKRIPPKYIKELKKHSSEKFVMPVVVSDRQFLRNIGGNNYTTEIDCVIPFNNILVVGATVKLRKVEATDERKYIKID